MKPFKIGQKVLNRNLKDVRRKEKLEQKWCAHPYTVTGISECGNVYVKAIWGKTHKRSLPPSQLSHMKMLIMYPWMKMQSSFCHQRLLSSMRKKIHPQSVRSARLI